MKHTLWPFCMKWHTIQTLLTLPKEGLGGWPSGHEDGLQSEKKIMGVRVRLRVRGSDMRSW